MYLLGNKTFLKVNELSVHFEKLQKNRRTRCGRSSFSWIHHLIKLIRPIGIPDVEGAVSIGFIIWLNSSKPTVTSSFISLALIKAMELNMTVIRIITSVSFNAPQLQFSQGFDIYLFSLEIISDLQKSCTIVARIVFEQEYVADVISYHWHVL